jgi:hypothetical protein
VWISSSVAREGAHGVKAREHRGAWWLFVDRKSRRKAKRIGTGKLGRKAAEQAAMKIQARLAHGDTRVFTPEPVTVPTFKEYAERWLARKNGKTSTVEAYRIQLSTHHLRALGTLPLNEIRRSKMGCL